MELKCCCTTTRTWLFASSNRTFMELKSNCEVAYDVAAESSNRTFMELKYNNFVFVRAADMF